MEEQVLTKNVPGDNKIKGFVAPVQVQISVITSVYNFEQEIASVYKALRQSLDTTGEQYEIIFVDDGSVDNSWAVLKEIAQKDSLVKLVRLRSSFGESATFDAGLHQAKGDKIVFLTTRKRVNPAHIPKLLSKLEQGFDLITGWRFPRSDSFFNQIISKTFNFLAKKISKINLHDMNSGVFATRKEVLDDIPLYGNLTIFLPILAVRKGFMVGDEKIEQLPGKFRQSKYFSEYIQRLLDIVTVIFLTNYSKKPLHFLGFFGIIFAIVGAVMNIYLFIYRLLQFGPIAGRPLLLLGALLLVIGIQMISIGLIGEMIIFTHAKEIKEYTIEEILE